MPILKQNWHIVITSELDWLKNRCQTYVTVILLYECWVQMLGY